MKKIFIILSVLSLFVGCASKPKKNDFIQQRFDAYNPNFAQDKEIIDLVYAPIVTYQEAEEAYGLAYYANEKEAKIKRMSYSTETNRKDFTGKITNSTDKEIHLRIFPRGEYTYCLENKDLPDVDFTILPHETYYFIIENYFLLNENLIAIRDMDSGYYVLSIGEDYNRYFPVFNEIMKTHSLELNYNQMPSITSVNKAYKPVFTEPVDEKIKNEKNLIIVHQPLD